MSYINTPNQGVPYPAVDEPLNNVNDWVFTLATFLETRGLQRFSNSADLGNKRPTPVAGELAFIAADKVIQVFDGTTWQRVFPPKPMVYTGTATPSSSLGSTGDLYVKTT